MRPFRSRYSCTPALQQQLARAPLSMAQIARLHQASTRALTFAARQLSLETSQSPFRCRFVRMLGEMPMTSKYIRYSCHANSL